MHTILSAQKTKTKNEQKNKYNFIDKHNYTLFGISLSRAAISFCRVFLLFPKNEQDLYNKQIDTIQKH